MFIDTHVHLGGCITSEFVWEVIQRDDLYYLGESLSDVISAMQFGPGEEPNFHKFLDKFKILDKIKWNEELIDKSIKSVCDYMDINNVDYAWLRFSINKYMDCMSWRKHEAIKFIYDAFEQYRPGKIGLMLSLKYESLRASQRQYAKLIEDERVAEKLIGIDLVGDEAHFDAEFYQPIFKEWKNAEKILCAHVGESQSVDNIRKAIETMHVTNVAHGLKITEDQELMQIALDKNVCFDMAITSNRMTGVCKDLSKHPIRAMLDYGLNITIGTDDPVQCSTNMAKEYGVLKNDVGLTDKDCNKIMANSRSITSNLTKY
tara:strand:+ start:2758 stop:3708 length:951 start_codon:yes stop_codon:yes gene_type:complete